MRLNESLTLADVERAARSSLDDAMWAYIAGGAGWERTVTANISAFHSVWLRPRIPITTQVPPCLSVTVLGHELSLPVLLAPTSPQRLLHEDAEIATARAAVAVGTISIVSTDSHYPFTVVAEKGRGQCWFQLYAYGCRAYVEAMIDMATNAGAQSLIVTVDAQHAARRISATRAGFSSPPYVDFGTLRSLGILRGAVPSNARIERLPLSWDDLGWIRQCTKIPLLIKGVLHPEDARRCVDIGADGIIVSNHGGRQLDGVMPSLAALEQVTVAVRDECLVLMDGGIRSGVDVVKALALGAHATCIGRPYLWGLGLDGQAGVEAVLGILRAEIEDTLLQLGLADVREVGRDSVAEIRWLSEAGEDSPNAARAVSF